MDASLLNVLTVSGANLATLYDGAAGDGHSVDLTQSILSGIDLSLLFSGGDGVDTALLADILLQGFMSELYEGVAGMEMPIVQKTSSRD